MKNVVGIVKAQLDDQKAASSKAAEAASKSSASTPPASPSSADPLADLEEDDMLKASASEAAAEPETTEIPTIYTDEDLKFIEDTHKNASKWLEEIQNKQKKLKESDDPAFTTKDVKDQTEKLNNAIMNMMMKKARFLNVPKQQKARAKASKPKKKADKKTKKSKKDEKAAAEDRKEPTQEELDEALRKAGVKGEGIKLQSFGHQQEIQDENGRILTKLDLGEDATEEDIMAAIDKATKEGREKLEREKEKEARERDEL